MLIAGGLVAGGITSFIDARRAADAEPATDATPAPVLVATVEQKDVPLYLEETGRCSATQTVKMQAQVSGQIIARHFDDGAQVKEGQLLFSIDSRPYQAALGQVQAQLALARAREALYAANLQRARKLFADGAIAGHDFELAKANLQSEAAKIRSAEAGVAAAQLSLEYCEIHSPLDGRAGLHLVDIGNIVTGGSGGTTLLTIAVFDPIYTDFTVPEADLPKVRSCLGKGKPQVQTIAPDDLGTSRLDVWISWIPPFNLARASSRCGRLRRTQAGGYGPWSLCACD